MRIMMDTLTLVWCSIGDSAFGLPLPCRPVVPLPEHDFLFKRVLPSYTSERYFLLSEIEEHGAILTLDADDAQVPSDARICFVYCLWKYADGIECWACSWVSIPVLLHAYMPACKRAVERV